MLAGFDSIGRNMKKLASVFESGTKSLLTLQDVLLRLVGVVGGA